PDAVHLGRELLLETGVPDRRRDVRPGGRRALLALVLEGTAGERGPEDRRVGARVGDDEVLAAGLADQARVGAVLLDVLADRLPQVLEGPGRAGEVDARQVTVLEGDLGDRDAVAGEEVDDALGQAGLLQQP